MRTWSEPTAGAVEQPSLAPRLEVQVLERRGAWASIRCSNGWQTWVEGARLEDLSLAAPAGGRRPRRARVIATLVVVVVVAAIAVVATRDDGNEQPVAATASPGRGVELNLPSGWVLSADGMTAAARAADLEADIPAGPRVRALLADAPAENEDVEIVRAALATAAPEITAEPERVSIDGEPAVAVTFREQAGSTQLVRRYLAATTPDGLSVLFVLEAPAAVFDANAVALGRVPGWGS
jgi:hypothetical protein